MSFGHAVVGIVVLLAFVFVVAWWMARRDYVSITELEPRISELNQKFNQILIFLSFALAVLATLKDIRLLSTVGPWWSASLIFVLTGILPVKEFWEFSQRWYAFIRWSKVWLLLVTAILIGYGSVLFLRALMSGAITSEHPTRPTSESARIVQKTESVTSDQLKHVVAGNVDFQSMRDASGKVMDFGASSLIDLTMDLFNATTYTLTEIDVELDERAGKERPIMLTIPLDGTGVANRPIPSGTVGEVSKQVGVLPSDTSWMLKVSGAKGYLR